MRARTKNRHFRGGAATVLAILLAGCAAFRSPDVETAPWPPVARGEKRSIKIVFSGVGGDLLRAFNRNTVAAYRDSGMFSRILTGSHPDPHELTAEIRVVHRGKANIGLVILCALTLTAIPTTAEDKYEVHTTFRHTASGRVLATAKATQRVRLWIHVTLLFIAPFFRPFAEQDALMYDLARASLIQAAGVGAFR